jgi:hypothetical protein
MELNKQGGEKMTRITDRSNRILALARKRARMDLEGLELSRKEYREKEAQLTATILDDIISSLLLQVEGSLS